MDLSIILPTLNEAENIRELVTGLGQALDALGITYEILVVDGGSTDETIRYAAASNAHTRVILQSSPGYGQALRSGFAAARGEFLITMDADGSHPPSLIADLWRARVGCDMAIASRYVLGGKVEMPESRRVASIVLNRFMSRGLSLPISDLSSGYRLNKARIVQDLKLDANKFDILAEIAVRVFAEGWRVVEIPLDYKPRQGGRSKAKLIRFGWAFLSTFVRMWRLRNSIDCADYDDRAYDSIIPLQRYWQRKRYEIVTRFASQAGMTLDIGCGSSRIIKALTPMVGVDILLRKLRYARKFGKPLANGSIWALPFRADAFDCVVCSEVIEHIPAGDLPFTEIRRVLKPGGRLVLGTPDYGPPWWRMFEAAYKIAAPGGYADEHITHYTRQSLIKLVERHGFVVNDMDYILGSELILSCTLKAKTE
ncbi:MAG: glycosyltransferase [Chloroflexi bacterium]|nr:glycosyltransferase [Chloroflexota bacterium]